MSDNRDDLLTSLSEQQRGLLRAFSDDGTATIEALHRAFTGEDRRLTRSEQASLSRAVRRLELRGLLVRKPEGVVELTPAGVALVFPARRQNEAERLRRLDQLRVDLDAFADKLRLFKLSHPNF